MSKFLLPFVLPFVAMWLPGSRSVAATQPAAATCSSLAETVRAPRWLSLPKSRLVVNPHIEAPPPTSGFSSPELALNLAYYAGERPTALPGLWSWQPQPRAGSGLDAGPQLDFKPQSAPLWKASGVTLEFEASSEASRARLRVADSYGSLSREVTVNLGQTPFLVIQVAGGSGGWALKANDGTQATDTPLVHDTSHLGTFAVNVAASTGWRGTKTFRVVLFALGGPGKTMDFSRLQFFGRPASSRLLPRATTWFPHQIVSGASSNDGALSVESTVALADESTIAQRLTVRKASPAPLLLSGQFTAGTVRWDASRRVLILRGEHFHAALSCSRPVRWLGVRASGLDWAMGEGTASASSASSGVWALAVDNLRAGEQIVVAAHFAPDSSAASVASTCTAATKMASPARFAAQLQQQERAWNRRLQSVPRPLDFSVRAVEPHGVSAGGVRRAYYTAWAFLFANILPPMAENNFPFPQQATGKPSLWSEGDPRAGASAQWDSMIAMQAMALVDPSGTWDAFEGMMSLVGADGSMNGEGLPSAHARTAWILYQQTGDERRLRRLYPAIKRLLRWKAANPRWILKNSTSPDTKDQEFVVHALVDTDFAARIATVLQMPSEVRLWQQQRRALAASLHEWFWQGEGGPSYRIYQAASGQRHGPNESWNLQALALGPDVLQPWARASLMQLLQSRLSPGVPFLVPNLTRFPNYELVRRGLWQSASAAQADEMADAAMRDTTLADEFAEFYSQDTPTPLPMGVWPSAFGARHIIDGVLWHNGVIANEGLPVLLLRPARASAASSVYGVENLRVRGKPASIVFRGGQPVVRGTSARLQVLAGGA